MQGTWENGQFVLASTKDAKIERLQAEAARWRRLAITLAESGDPKPWKLRDWAAAKAEALKP